jgi:membrane-associated phospholipid phosphatase
MKKILLILFLFPAISIYSQNIDINILRDINLNRNRQLDGTFRFITNSVTPLSIGTPVILFGLGLMKKDSATLNKSFYIGATALTAAVVSTVLKHAVNRTRPFITYPFIEKAAYAGSPSFPSGHTSDAFALATSLSIAYPKWYVIIPSYTWAGLVGYSRMDLGVHYPSDVLGGAVIGGGSAYLCYKGQQWLNRKKVSKEVFWCKSRKD